MSGETCGLCGWPRRHHRETPEGERCPYQRSNRAKRYKMFTPKEPVQ